MKFLLPIIIVLIILAGGYFVTNQSLIPEKVSSTKSPASSPASQKLKTFQSKLMKFSIDIPKEFEPIENLGRVTISSEDGKVYVDRNATNFGSLDDYLNDLNSRNKPEILKEGKKSINNYQAVNRSIRLGTGEVQKEIIIFADGWIYYIFTNVESLYGDLDQIAQSFRYIP